MRKQFKAERSCKQEVLMNAEFRYKGPRREMGFRYVGRERAYLGTVIVFGIVALLVAVIVTKKLLGL